MQKYKRVFRPAPIFALSLGLGLCLGQVGYPWAGSNAYTPADSPEIIQTFNVEAPPPYGGEDVPMLLPPGGDGGFVENFDNGPVYTSSFNAPMPQTYTPQTFNTVMTPQPNIPYNPQSGDYFSLQGEGQPVWKEFPLKVYVDDSEKLSSDANTALKWAIGEWKRYFPMEITREKSLAHIRVEWVNEVRGKGHSRLSETQVLSTAADEGGEGKQILKRVKVELVKPERYDGLADRAMRGVILHEMGHALGIRRDSDVDGDVMAEPEVDSRKGKAIQEAVKSLAMKGLDLALSTQGINWSLGRTNTKTIEPKIRVVETISQRDLNTLYRLYGMQDNATAHSDPFGTYPPAF